MSYLSGGKNKEKDGGLSSQFYVEFLGWMECRGVRGAHYTDPIIRELKMRQKKVVKPPKLTIQVSTKDLKITQEVDEPKKKGIKKIKFPTIPARDITYVRQGRHSDGRLDDVVACIYLGYMPRTQRYVHVHVYRFDEASTAVAFTKQLEAIVETNYQRVLDVETELMNKREIDDSRVRPLDFDNFGDDSAVGSTSSAFSDEERLNILSEDIDPDLQSLKDVMPFDNVAEELKFRLQMGDAPLLLPPKDYDTIRRGHGNLTGVKERRCLNIQIVGQNAIPEDAEDKDRFGSNESGVDSASPGSDSTDKASVEPSANHHSTSISPGISPLQLRKPVKEEKPNSGNQLKPDRSSKSSQHSGSTSPGTPPVSTKDFVYPPKTRSPPSSPPLYRSQLSKENKMVKQTSLNSYPVEAVTRAPADFAYRNDKPTHYYPNEDVDDIYAMPVKVVKGVKKPSAAEVEIPPDYDDDIVFNGNIHSKAMYSKIDKTDPRYRQQAPPPMKRNLSEDNTRNGALLADNWRKDANPYSGAHKSVPLNDKAYASRPARTNSTKK